MCFNIEMLYPIILVYMTMVLLFILCYPGDLRIFENGWASLSLFSFHSFVVKQFIIISTSTSRMVYHIWQDIEFSRSKPQACVDLNIILICFHFSYWIMYLSFNILIMIDLRVSTGVMFDDVAGIEEAMEERQKVPFYFIM